MTQEQRDALLAAAAERKAEIEAQAADKDRLSASVKSLKALVADGLPTSLTKWATFGARLLKIINEM